MAKNPMIVDMTAQKSGMWTVVCQNGNAKKGGALWLCRCECGNERNVLGYDLRSMKSKSCGCANPAVTEKLKLRHGQSGTKLHKVWRSMVARCYNSRTPSFKGYGARGIAVVDEWLIFDNFKIWAGSTGYSDGLSIERNDVNGDYTPDNCRWIPQEQQAFNKRNSNKAPDGELWVHKARRNGISTKTYKGRLAKGWPFEDAASLPKGSIVNPRARDEKGRYI